MHGLGTLPALVLPALLARAPLTPEKITFVWGIAVGPAIARATAVTLTGSALLVRTSEQAWAREIDRSAPLIVDRIKRLLGPDVVKSLVVQRQA